jgi:hypothetical protein
LVVRVKIFSKKLKLFIVILRCLTILSLNRKFDSGLLSVEEAPQSGRPKLVKKKMGI